MVQNQPKKRPNGSGITRSPGLVLIHLHFKPSTKKKYKFGTLYKTKSAGKGPEIFVQKTKPNFVLLFCRGLKI